MKLPTRQGFLLVVAAMAFGGLTAAAALNPAGVRAADESQTRSADSEAELSSATLEP